MRLPNQSFRVTEKERMIVDKEVSSEEKGEGECILVGFQSDGDGRELLSWALTNIAGEGARLVAVNVCRSQDRSRMPAPCLIKFLDDILLEHEDLCTRKKVILAGHFSREKSFKKMLLKEAELCSPNTVVVGANKNYSFGGSASLVKYCAKKLPSTISLIAVHKGKIIFERAAAKSLSGGQKMPNLRSFLHPNVGLDTKDIPPRSRVKSDAATVGLSIAGNEDVKQIAQSSKDNCLLDHEKMRERNTRSLSVLVSKLPEQKPGWPLLRRAVTANSEALKDIEARKMPVVQWAMKLPNRSLPSTQLQVYLLKELEIILGINASSCKLFQYEELQNCTNYFSPDNLIGKGGNSLVYKGYLPNGQQVAIKVSNLSEESLRDFLLEIDIITRLQHDHIVPLIGFCVEDKNHILVYSYFTRGSLEENLHGKRVKESPLDWDMRFKVAVGIAEALNYIHEDCSRPAIHRDVKSSNILLSDECRPQLSDFGLAIWAPTASPYLTDSDVVGTFGYLAPEYFMYGRVSSKIDVYAFGVVLLELLTGRKPINDKSPKGRESLVIWATPLLERGDIMKLLDPNLDGKYEEYQMKRMALAASLCIRRAASRRPQMSQVLSLLQGEEGITPWMSSDVNSNLSEPDCQDDETYPDSRIGSHLGLALLDVDDDASVMSYEQNQLNSMEEYLQDRWSRSSSFD